MFRSPIRPVFAGTSLALSLLLMSAGALAQQTPATTSGVTAAPADTKQAERHAKPGKSDDHRRGESRAMSDGLLILGLGSIPKQLVDELKLTAAQQKQFDETRTSQREAGKAMHQARQSGRAALQAQLDTGKLDPRALLAEQDRLEIGRQAARERWLAFWDSLDATQQAKVAEFVKSHHERRAERTKQPRKAPAA